MLLLLLVAAVFLTVPTSAQAVTVTFTDPTLEIVVRWYLNISQPVPVTDTDMLRLTNIYVPSAQITNLVGLQHATNMTRLDLANNQISDLSPLSGLTNLTDLNLSMNQISDLSPLSGLTNLTDLDLDSNQISDLSPLSGLTNLTQLYLIDNQISSLSPLSGLANLTQLWLGSNQISDLSPLSGLANLTQLSLMNNQISDLSPLSGLTNLKQLYLINNQISSLSPLSGLTNLNDLWLNGNKISSLSPLVSNAGIGPGDTVLVASNRLSLTSGSAAMADINTLIVRGVSVDYQPQNPSSTINPSMGPGGSISPSTAQTVAYGDDLTFTITPDQDYHIEDVLIDGTSIGASSSVTFDGVVRDHTLAVTFEVDTYKITASAPSTGVFTGKWGSQGSAEGDFNNPTGAAVAPNGDVYVVDPMNHRIQYFDSTGAFKGKWLGTDLTDVAIAPSGDLYITDNANDCVYHLGANGSFGQWGTSGTGDGQFELPVDAAVAPNGDVYVVDLSGLRVQYFSSNGTYKGQWGSGGTGDGQFSAPRGVSVAPNGDVYVVDWEENRVQYFSATGTYKGQWGSPGAGNGQFAAPNFLAVAPNGNVYVTDAQNSRVQYFTPEGTYLGQWGSRGTGDGQFYSPAGIAFAPNGDAYVADFSRHRVQRFGARGTISPPGVSDVDFGETVTYTVTPEAHYHVSSLTVDGNPVSLTAGQYVLNDVVADHTISASFALDTYTLTYTAGDGGTVEGTTPQTVDYNGSGTEVTAVANDGYHFVKWSDDLATAVRTDVDIVADKTVSAIFARDAFDISASTVVSAVQKGQWGSNGSGNGQFAWLTGIAVAPNGDVYVTDTYNYRVQYFDSTGTYKGQWGGYGTEDEHFAWPVAVAVAPNGDVYVVDNGTSRIKHFSPTGEFRGAWGSYGTGEGQFRGASGVAIAPSGDVYVMDGDNFRVQQFSSAGVYERQWGSYGYGDGQFSWMTGIAVAPDGDVYALDAGSYRIQRFSANGVYEDQLGSLGIGVGQFSNPTGIAVASNGDVYVTESNGNRTQYFSANGTYIGQWGSPGGSIGQLTGRNGVAVAADGTVYTSFDLGNFIRFFDSNGTITPSGVSAVEPGASAVFTVTPDPGYHLSALNVDGSSASTMGGQYVFADVRAPHTVSASFALNTYMLTYTAADGGTIEGTTPQSVDHNGSGTEVTAVANDGYHFVKWSDDLATAARTDVDVAADKTVNAIFARDDTAPPVTTVSGVPAGWSRDPFTIGFDATDPATPGAVASGVAATHYRLLPSPNIYTFAAPFEYSLEGSRTMEYWSVDASGNAETAKTVELRRDYTHPETTDDHVDTYTTTAVIHLSATDAVSGVGSIKYSLDSEPLDSHTGDTVTVTEVGQHTLTYRAYDVAGNQEDAHTVSFTVLASGTTPPIISTPASSRWSIALCLLAGILGVIIFPGTRREIRA